MYCRNCGAEIHEGNAFCEQCGTPVDRDMEAPKGPSPEETTGRSQDPSGGPASEPKKKNRKLLIIAVVVIAACCIGALTAFLSHGQGAEYKSKLETARQYVSEEQLDKAETAYLELIDLEPKEQEPYLELSDVYVKQEKFEKARAILDQGQDATGNRKAFEEPIKKVMKKFEGVWKTAYRSVLEEYQTDIEKYEYQEYRDAMAGTALCDVNGDDIPELFLIEIPGEAYGTANLHIYGYRDGQAIELDCRFPVMNLERTGEMADHFQDVAAASGTTYVIYKSKTDNHFVICATIADESSELTVCEYTMDEKMNISQEYWGHLRNIQFDESGSFTGHEDEYYHMEETIDKAEFDKQEKRLADDMEQVLIRTPRMGEDDLILNKGIQETPAGKYCADMIRDLTVKETGSNKEPSSEDTGLLQELNGTAFSFSSGAGAWGTGLEFSEDGSFKGSYHDSDMGDTGDGYPNGVRYQSVFSGKFGSPKKTGDYEYTLTLETLDVERSSGEEIQDEVLIRYSEPYGLENLKPGDTIKVLAPGYPIANLTEDEKIWITYVETGDTLQNYCLLNETPQYVFYSGMGE